MSDSESLLVEGLDQNGIELPENPREEEGANCDQKEVLSGELDDGFRTPTGSEHRIQPPEQCPMAPAPKRLRFCPPPIQSRKTARSRARRRRTASEPGPSKDSSFPPPPRCIADGDADSDGVSGDAREIKKARTDHAKAE